jgi:hypothetical protein
MKLTKSFTSFALNLSLVLSFLSFTVPSVSAQESNKIALQRGYRTGYSDGYMSGYRDAIDNASKSLKRHKDYETANRAYNKDYGAIEDYRDGYRQGFEIGYDTGYEKRSFDAAFPPDLSRRGIVTPEKNIAETEADEQTSAPETSTVSSEKSETYSENTSVSTENAATNKQAVIYNRTDYKVTNQNSDAIIIIPKDTELVVELLNEVTTEHSKVGEKFEARVVSPFEITGAIIEGRISKIQKPGRLKRRGEVILSFDRIVLTDQRWSNYNAILAEVVPIKGDNIRRVDTEGTIEGKSSLKNDITTVGATTGTGLVIGAIAGGPVGAAVGAGVGGAFGVGAVVIERGKHVSIQKNQQLRIKTSYETQIR